MRNSSLRKTCRYFTWLVIMGMVGSGSTILAKDASHPRFPERWMSKVQSPEPWTRSEIEPAVGMERECHWASSSSGMSLLTTSEMLISVQSLPFFRERRDAFLQFISGQNVTQDEWHHISGQIKFRDETEEFRRLWSSQEVIASHPFCIP